MIFLLYIGTSALIIIFLTSREQRNIVQFCTNSHQSPSPLVSGKTPKGGTTERQCHHTKRCPIRRARWARDLQPGDKWHEKSDSRLLAIACVVIKLNFGSDFEQKVWLWFEDKVQTRFWSWNFVSILLLMFVCGYGVESWSMFSS